MNIDEPKNTEESQDIQSDLQELSGAGETGPQSPTHPVDAMENDAASQGPGFTEQAAPANVPVAKKMLGMSKPVAITVIAFVSALILAAVTIGLVKYLGEVAEQRDHATSTYLIAHENYKNAVDEFHAEYADAKKSELSYAEDDVTSADVLTAFRGSLKESASLAELDVMEKLDVDGTSNEDLLSASEMLSEQRGKMVEATHKLAAAQRTLLADVEAKRVADEEARKAAELAAKKASAIATSYEDLFRAGDTVFGAYFRFEGKIIQDAGSGSFRISITKDPGYSRVFWKDPILVTVVGDPSQRLLENDIVSFVGASLGITSYNSIFGQSISVPLVTVDAADISVTGRDG